MLVYTSQNADFGGCQYSIVNVFSSGCSMWTSYIFGCRWMCLHFWFPSPSEVTLPHRRRRHMRHKTVPCTYKLVFKYWSLHYFVAVMKTSYIDAHWTKKVSVFKNHSWRSFPNIEHIITLNKSTTSRPPRRRHLHYQISCRFHFNRIIKTIGFSDAFEVKSR